MSSGVRAGDAGDAERQGAGGTWPYSVYIPIVLLWCGVDGSDKTCDPVNLVLSGCSRIGNESYHLFHHD
jgi:hypothetical protein